MTRRSDYDQWVQDWIAEEKAKGRKCFDVKKVVNAYYVYYQTTRYNSETGKREKVTSYIGKLVKGKGLVEARSKSSDAPAAPPARYGLGVDTGGTFTDAVIIDLDDYTVVAKHKSPTTHKDLSVGLYRSVDAVFRKCSVRPSDITLIGVSTTLATNSVLEGNGGEVGLIFIGWNPDEPVHFGEKRQAFVDGGFDAKGKMISELDMDQVRSAIRSVSEDVDAIAISGLFSVVDSSQERTVKRMAMEMTGLPTVAGYELSSTLGIDVRAETAVLNGRLIPMVRRFFDGLEDTFRKKGLTAPIMVYKGDGSVMTMERARTYPVETVFSGPAASSMGGKITSGRNNFIMVDIGGTSTDIAIVEDGMPRIQEEGANVGGWRTRVKAVDMNTTAMGGDSRISVRMNRLVFGPKRVTPLCRFTERYPEIVDGIRENGVTDHYLYLGEKKGVRLTERELRVVSAMDGKGPMSAVRVKDETPGLWVIDDELDSLVSKGVVESSSLTPTDVMCYLGMFESGNRLGAEAGISVLAHRFGVGTEAAAESVMEEIYNRVSEAVLHRLMDESFRGWESEESGKILRQMSMPRRKHGFDIVPRVDVPIVGIGAPTPHMMAGVGRRLGTKVLFPENSDVGNAIGAVSSKMVASLTANIYPTNDFRYKAMVPFIGSSYHSKLADAIDSAKKNLGSLLAEQLRKEYASNITISYSIHTFDAIEGGIGGMDDAHADRNVTRVEIACRAIGDPPEAVVGDGRLPPIVKEMEEDDHNKGDEICQAQ